MAACYTFIFSGNLAGWTGFLVIVRTTNVLFFE